MREQASTLTPALSLPEGEGARIPSPPEGPADPLAPGGGEGRVRGRQETGTAFTIKATS